MGIRTTFRDLRRFRNWNDVHHKRTNLWKIRNPRVDILLREGTTDSWVAREIFFDRAYTRQFDVRKGDVVFDLGAHIGLFSLYAHAKGARSVFAFEPNPSNFKALVANVALNSARNISTFNAAVLPGTATARFHMPTGKSKDIGTLFGTDGGGFEDIPVDCVSLDAFVERNEIQRIDFLKLDVEGAEHKILAETMCLDRIEKISMEAHDIEDHTKEDVVRRLHETGFQTMAQAANTDARTLYVYAWKNASINLDTIHGNTG